MKEYALSADTLLEQVHSSANGLTSAEAQERLATYGPNRLKEAPSPRSSSASWPS